MNQHFCEKNNIVMGSLIADLGAGATSGKVISMKNYGRCAIVFIKEPGAAGDDPVLTVMQATSIAASTNKALPISDVRKKQAATDISAVAEFTKSTPTSPASNDTFTTNTWTNSDLAEQAAVVVIDIKAEDLDIANGYDCLYVTIADPGSIGQYGTVHYILHDPKYQAAALPGAIAD